MVDRISPKEAQRRMVDEGYLYLDVRSVPEFEEGHPEGAYNLPLMHRGAGGMEPNPDFLAVAERAFPKDTKIITGCLSGGRSLKAAELLTKYGWTDVLDQRAGWGGSKDAFGQIKEPGWEASELPTESTAAAGRRYSELAQ